MKKPRIRSENANVPWSDAEVSHRFNLILRGAMHKPTRLKDIPRKRKEKATRPSPSRVSGASAKSARP